MVLAVAGEPAGARGKHAAIPQTGLRTVAFAKAPPDFTFDLGAGPTRLSQLVGKPVVLNFWASWCHPCRDELDAFVRLRHAYGDAVSLLTLSDEDGSGARDYLAGSGLSLPLVVDADKKIFGAYSVSTIPVTIVIRPDGTVANVTIGELTWDELRDQVAAVAGQVDSPPAAPTGRP